MRLFHRKKTAVPDERDKSKLWKGCHVPTYNHEEKLWGVENYFGTHCGDLNYISYMTCGVTMSFPYRCGDGAVDHAENFEQILSALNRNPETFSIQGYESKYSDQERRLLAALQEALLKSSKRAIHLHGRKRRCCGANTAPPPPLPQKGNGHRMKIYFKLRKDGYTILSFDLNGNTVSNMEIFHEALAMEALRNPACTMTPGRLRELFQYYLGGEGTLEEYFDHIEAHTFFSPYQPGLVVEIEGRS